MRRSTFASIVSVIVAFGILAAIVDGAGIYASAQVSGTPGGVSYVGGAITTDTVNNITNVTNNFSVAQNAVLYSLPNSGTVGTATNLIAKETTTGARTVLTTDTTGEIVGICNSNCGTTGNANIAIIGQQLCQFDNGITTGDFVVVSTSAAGKCSDGGATVPTAVQVIGIVLSATNGSPGTYTVDLNPVGLAAAIVQQSNNKATPLTTGTSVTLKAPSAYFVCTNACTIGLPTPSPGYEFCVWNDDNKATAITFSALGGSRQFENTARTAYGTAGTGTAVSGGAAGDKLCLVALDSTHYQVASFNGTWTMN